MKTFNPILFTFCSFFAALASFGQSPSSSIVFEELTYDFEEINQGQQLEAVFHFTNHSSDTTRISDVVTQCGCTASHWPKNAILPHQTSTVTLTFDAAHQEGFQRKTANVRFGNGFEQKLILYANVLKKD